MSKFIEWHNRQVDWWKDKLNISWYGVAWIAFAKGVVLTVIVYQII